MNGDAPPAKPGLHHSKNSNFSATFCVRPSELFAGESVRQDRSSSGQAKERRSFISPPEERSDGGNDRVIAVKLPFEVVTGQIPPHLLERLQRDFSDEEIEPSVTVP